MTAALTTEELAAMEARATAATHAIARVERDFGRNDTATALATGAALASAADMPRLLADHARQREEIARLTAALDGAQAALRCYGYVCETVRCGAMATGVLRWGPSRVSSGGHRYVCDACAHGDAEPLMHAGVLRTLPDAPATGSAT